ncbi:MAG: FkbM family methyltransferase [Rhizobacter sp.]|nr:FkbM family methyltransferase [Rhizobacter sp.]
MRTLPASDIVAGADGLRYILFEGTDTHGISQCIRNRGTYEVNLQVVATALLNARPPGGRVLDIGSNLGSFTIPLASRFRTHSFECFEVQRPIYYQLCGNIVLNGLANVVAHQLGLGRAAGEIEVALPRYEDDINLGSFSLDAKMREGVRGGDFAGEKVKVRLVNLDSLSLDDVRLVKIDVEGMELDVLRGACGTLTRNGFPPVIYEAWHFDWYAQQKAELEAFLRDLGYLITNFDGSENYVAQHPKSGPVLTRQ